MYCTFFGLQWWSPIMPFCCFFRYGHSFTFSVVHEGLITVNMIPLRYRDEQEARKALKKSTCSVFNEWSPLSLHSSQWLRPLPGNSCNFGPNDSSRTPPSPSSHLSVHWVPSGERSSCSPLLTLGLGVAPGNECQRASCCVHVGNFI